MAENAVVSASITQPIADSRPVTKTLTYSNISTNYIHQKVQLTSNTLQAIDLAAIGGNAQAIVIFSTDLIKVNIVSSGNDIPCKNIFVTTGVAGTLTVAYLSIQRDTSVTANVDVDIYAFA